MKNPYKHALLGGMLGAEYNKKKKKMPLLKF